MIGRTNAGGSDKLGFRVMSGMSNPFASPKWNDIWVKSSIPVTNVLLASVTGWKTTEGAVNLIWNSASHRDSENRHFIGNYNGHHTQVWTMPTDCLISDGSKLVRVDAYIWRGEWVKCSNLSMYVVKDGVYQNGITWSSSATLTQGPPEWHISHDRYNHTVQSSNVTVPTYAKNLHIEFSKLRTYYEATISFLGHSVNTPENSYDVAWSTVIPVGDVAGLTGQLSLYFRGVSDGDWNNHYITNIWFD